MIFINKSLACVLVAAILIGIWGCLWFMAFSLYKANMGPCMCHKQTINHNNYGEHE